MITLYFEMIRLGTRRDAEYQIWESKQEFRKLIHNISLSLSHYYSQVRELRKQGSQVNPTE